MDEMEHTHREIVYQVAFTFDYKYWTTGCINFNFHSGDFEIEFLCFGFYIGRKPNDDEEE